METNLLDATPVYFVTTAGLPKLRDQFARIARRAAKLGMTPPTLVERTTFDEVRTKRDQFDRLVKYLIARTVCTVEGFSPKLHGWSLLAAIEHVENETMIHTFDATADLTAFRGANNVCEHCNTNRRRQSTFVMRHEDGTVKQIGRNCLVDFIGSPDACRQFAAAAEMLASALDACSEDEDGEGGYGGSGVAKRWPLVDFLAWTWAAVREFGWMSKSKCNDGDVPTSTRVVIQLAGVPSKLPRIPDPTEVDTQRAEETIAFIESSTEQSEFLENLRVICRLGSVREKHSGLAAAMVAVFDRELTKRAAAAAKLPSAFVGTVGERIITTLTLTRVHYLEGDYGVRTIARFNDASGNDLVWFASGQPDWLHNDKGDALIGESFEVKATIKEHKVDKYTSRDTTTLARVQPYTPPAPKTPKPRRKKGDLTAKQEKAIEFARDWSENCDRRGYGYKRDSYRISIMPGHKSPDITVIDSLVTIGIAFRSDEWGFPDGGYRSGSWGLNEWRNNETSDAGGTASTEVNVNG